MTILELERTKGVNKSIIDILVSAINDWPEPTSDLEDYELQVSRFLMNIANKQEIDNTLKTIDYSKHSWHAESLAQLIDVFEFYVDGISLKEIIGNLNQNICL